MLAEVIDAVIGVDTPRDTHHAEIAYPTGAAIATRSINNTSAAKHSWWPGSRTMPPAHGW